VRQAGGEIRWSGAFGPTAIADAWRDDRFCEIILPDAPAELGAVAGAILRVACHSQQIKMHASPALWGERVRRLGAESLHAEGMMTPTIVAGVPGGAGQDAEEFPSERLARILHQSLDAWMIGKVNDHLVDYLATGADPGHRVGLSIARELRHAMVATWEAWRVAFDDDPALRSHFLRLMVCAVDDAGDRDVAQVLVGPTKLSAIIRGAAVALAIATSWRTTAPSLAGPGNLLRAREGAGAWAGHGCVADRIDGKPMMLCAGDFMWQTQFVILTVMGTVELAKRANTSFSEVRIEQPSLSQTDGSGPVIMSISEAFRSAASDGIAAFAAMLADVEARHFSRLQLAIEKAPAP
jgi:hypothetical protein